ncbi:MAG: hypothetical protein FJ387_19680 [Verrucomicrobia bacterium]|nr:hypothetical protein [Verrucomicrobiota bacterium]
MKLLRRSNRFATRAGLGLLGFSLVAVASALEPGPAQLYRVLYGSTLTLEGPGDGPSLEFPLRGTFRMRSKVSPLDWASFRVEEVALQFAEPAGPSQPVLGSGFYSVGGRTELTQRMELDLTLGGASVRVASGAVAPSPDWPRLEIALRGAADGKSRNYTLVLVAVPELERWRYRLLDGSYLLDDCPPCGRPTVLEPLRGRFDLVLFEEHPIRSRYALDELELAVGAGEFERYRLRGGGTFEVGGEVALRQAMRLATVLTEGQEKLTRGFTNSSSAVVRRWPLLEVDLDDTAGEFARVFRLRLFAAPFREIWFSTASGMTSGTGGEWPHNRRSGGDLLTDDGRVVRSNRDLIRRLGFEPGTADLGIDAFEIGPGGEVLFSLTEAGWSETFGQIQEGDLLSEQGRLVQSNQSLLAAFGLMPPLPDLGLDAVQVRDTGEVWFSIRQGAFSQTLGRPLGRGDLLSSQGQVVKSNAELLAGFRRPAKDYDYGLDAVHVWPSGEVWLSIEEGFQDADRGPVTDGDLLSDQGYVVSRNLDLVSAFQPLEDLANFGLDGLFVVTDLAVPPKPARFNPIVLEGTAGVRLEWEGQGRVYRVERTLDLSLPFEAVSPILPQSFWADPGPSVGTPRAFYRLRQW